MAIAQTKAQGRGMGQVHPSSDKGYNYIMIGTVWFVVGSGAPVSGDLNDAPAGSIYVRSQESVGTAGDSELFIKNASSGTHGWAQISKE